MQAYQGFQPFTLTGLQSGVNTLQFLVFNSPVGATPINPTALRLDFTSVTLGTAAPSTLSLFDTGVDASGSAVSGNPVDLHYSVSLPDGSTGTAYVATNPAYVPDDSTSRWVTIDPDTNEIEPTGDYTWTTHFTIPSSVDPAQVLINGQWSSDNEGVSILVNGVATGVSNDNVTAYTGWSSFTLSGPFHTGDNTIQFVVDNSSVGAGSINPTALRVEFNSVFLPPSGTSTIAGSNLAAYFALHPNL